MKGIKRYGRGLNSIRWRFGLASLVLTAGGFALRDWLGGRSPVEPVALSTLLLLALGAASITFALASRLTGSIAALKRSADRIAAGGFDSPVSLDCDCEVGGLAQSFAQMTRRLNANLVRMNGLAYTDGVTGLPNRSALLHVLEVAFSEAHRRDFRAAVLFLDLDDFKHVNDTLGHDAGDELLRQVGRRVVEVGLGRTMESIDMCTDAFGSPCQRLPNDVVFGRFAGDEFIAILPGLTDRAELTRIAASVVSSFREPFVVGGQELSICASVGIATTADQPAGASELIAFADLAMYTAKQSGKAGAYLFEQGLRVEARAGRPRA